MFQSVENQHEEMDTKHYLELLVDVCFANVEPATFIVIPCCDCFTSPECVALGAPLPEGSSKLVSLQIKEYYKGNVTMKM